MEENEQHDPDKQPPRQRPRAPAWEWDAPVDRTDPALEWDGFEGGAE